MPFAAEDLACAILLEEFAAVEELLTEAATSEVLITSCKNAPPTAPVIPPSAAPDNTERPRINDPAAPRRPPITAPPPTNINGEDGESSINRSVRTGSGARAMSGFLYLQAAQ